MYLILLVILALTLLYVKLKKIHSYWSDRGVKQRKQTYILGDFASIMLRTDSVFNTLRRVYETYPEERYIGIYQLVNPALLLRDPDLIKQILVKDFDHFVDHRPFIPDSGDELWSRNLFSLKGDRWRDMRATMTPSFTTSKMKMIFSLVSECAEDFSKYFVDSVKDVKEVELKDLFTRYTNDMIANVAFGIKVDSLREPENEFYLMGKEVTSFTSFWKMWKMFLFMTFPRFCKMLGVSMFRKEVGVFFKRVVKETMELRQRQGIKRPDMLQLLMEESASRKNPEAEGNQTVLKNEISEVDITAQGMIFFFGGFESVSTLMCFLGYELAVNPEVQLKLQKEIDETLEEGKGVLTYEALHQMKYMDMVLSEALRKWPVIVATDRECTKPYTLRPEKSTETPVHIEEGGLISIPISAIHWDSRFFPQPERFDPERFSYENKGTIKAGSYIPFGTGPRSCIGSRFALIETKTLFFHLLSKFDLVVTEKTQIPLRVSKKSGTLTAEGGFWIDLKLRQ